MLSERPLRSWASANVLLPQLCSMVASSTSGLSSARFRSICPTLAQRSPTRSMSGTGAAKSSSTSASVRQPTPAAIIAPIDAPESTSGSSPACHSALTTPRW